MRSPRRVATGRAYTRDQAPKRVLTHAKIVPCPVCKVDAGELCLSSTTGLPQTTSHESRKKMAAREVARRAESL